MYLNNFSKLMAGNDVQASVKEAKQDALKRMVSSEGQNSGWGGLESFLVKLCSLFSERCREVNNTLTELEGVKSFFTEFRKVNNIPDSGNSISRNAYKLYLISEIYQHFGLDLKYQVTKESYCNYKYKLILNGQSRSDSSVSQGTEDVYRYEMGIPEDEAIIFKALAGDALPLHSKCNPYFHKNFWEQECGSVSENRKELTMKLAEMPANDITTIMKVVQSAKGVIENLKENINNTSYQSGTDLTPTLFHNMYLNENGNPTPYNFEDFQAVCPTIIHGAEKEVRQQVYNEVQKNIKEIETSIEQRIKTTEEERQQVIKRAADTLKRSLASFQEGTRSILPEQDWAKLFPLQDYNNCISYIDKCTGENPNDGLFEDAINKANAFINKVNSQFENKIKQMEKEYTSKLDTYQKQISKENRAITGFESEQTKINQEISEATAEKENYEQQIETKEQIRTNLKKTENAISEEKSKYNAEKQEQQALLDNLKQEAQSLSNKREDLQQKQNKLMDDCCSKLSEFSREMRETYLKIKSTEDDGRKIASDNDAVLQSAERKQRTYSKVNLENILEDGKVHIEVYADALIGLNKGQSKVIELFDKHFNYAKKAYKNDIFSLIEENNLLTKAEEANKNIPSSIRTKITNAYLNVNENELRNFLKRLDTQYIDELSRKASFWDWKKIATKKKELDDGFDAKYNSIKEVLSGFIQTNNAVVTSITDLQVLYGQKASAVDILYNTVQSAMSEVNSYNDAVFLEEFDKLNDTLAKLETSCSTETEGTEQLKNHLSQIRTECQNGFFFIKNNYDKYKGAIERLYNTGLSKLAIADTKSTGLVYQFNVFNLETNLTEQEKEDIRLVLDFVSRNHYSVVAEHHIQNKEFITELQTKLSGYGEKMEKLNANLEEYSKKYNREQNELAKSLTENRNLLDSNKEKQENITTEIDILVNKIDSKEKELNKLTHNISVLEKENAELGKKVGKINKSISKNEIKLEELAHKLTASTEKIEKAQLECNILELNIGTDKLYMESVNKQFRKTSNSVTALQDQNQATFAEIDSQLNSLKRAQSFTSTVNTNISQFDSWVKNGHIGVQEPESYDGLVFPTKISHTLSSEEAIKIISENDYYTIKTKTESVRDGDDSRVVSNLVNQINGDSSIRDIQEKQFNQLFENRTNKNELLLADVYDSFNKYCTSHNCDVNFESFSEYIGYTYNLVNSLKNAGRKDTPINESVIASVANDLNNKTIDLYKAQAVFGIYMMSVLNDSDYKERVNAHQWDESLCARFQARDFGKVFYNPKTRKNENPLGDVFTETLNQWNEKHPSQTQNISSDESLQEMFDGQDKTKLNRFACNFIINLIHRHKYAAYATMQTGELINTQLLSAAFVNPSIEPLRVHYISRSLSGVQYLFGVTDVAGQAAYVTTRAALPVIEDDNYQLFFNERKEWLQKQGDFNQQVFNICNRMNLRKIVYPDSETLN